ncbi:radical SAM family heme chaperone HemW [Marmoricola sp. URHB0036]|uniref:radical SAM family heme chaperone HemW n=1 Tax=Marmoricola sp. URHB0036 TaxID=1298863 RepID=UPI0003F7DCDD|nr:radical SAM family heme chaperone HemW [Marmoricola sp. URHB0036]
MPAAPSGVPFGFYVHVPFCAVRCGYCDFNTYTATELGGGGSQAAYAGHAVAEVAMAASVLGPDLPSVETVFFGGGTPTLLVADDLNRILAAIDTELGLAPGAEVTTEANPDSVTPESLAALRAGGFNRISFGMQSAVPHVLQVLERTHDPARVAQAVGWAREAGFAQVSLDLIYGTPGESLSDWQASVDAALACEPDHVSAYSLIVEDGTRLARQVRTGVIPAPDDDDLADKYVLADDAFSAAGLEWYEVSNWARDEQARCGHNELYWTSASWWGIGPGAHSHVAGERWWNVKHPSAYAARITAGESPAQDGEVLDEQTRAMERVLLEIRLRDGLPLSLVSAALVDGIVSRGLAEREGDRLVLTRRGRLLGDAVVRELV